LQDSSDNAEWQLREELTARERPELRTQVQKQTPRPAARLLSTSAFFFCILPSDFMTGIYNRSMLALAVTAVSAAAAVAAGYQSMAPMAQWYGRTFTGLTSGSRQIALTYDDGPNDPHTLRLLEVLARHGVRATFFLIGRFVEQRPEIAREIVQAGHIIGNHTFTHPLLIFKSEAEIRQELTQCRSALEDAIGQASNLFRPPFGGRRPAVFRVARELGLEPIMWNVTGYDWNAPAAAVIERKVTRQIRGGDVILLHDGGHKQMGADRSNTVRATDHLIPRYKSEGYDFLTIPQMMGG
jgi:peptidoglycan-N-acetylglucosamine deacetylase